MTLSPFCQNLRSNLSVGEVFLVAIVVDRSKLARYNVRCRLWSRVEGVPVKVGVRVEVRNRFEAGWSRGFEIAEIIEAQHGLEFKVKRRSDGSLLPSAFSVDDLREERRRQTWWQ